MLMGLCEAERLSEQPKMWAHLFKNPHYIFEKHHIGNDIFLQKSQLGFCKNTRSEIIKIRMSALPQHQEFREDDLSLFCKS